MLVLLAGSFVELLCFLLYGAAMWICFRISGINPEIMLSLQRIYSSSANGVCYFFKEVEFHESGSGAECLIRLSVTP